MEVTKKRMEFFLPMVPPTTTHQQKQVKVIKGKPIFFEPAELKAARAKLKAHFAKHVPEKPYTGAVMLWAKWCFSLREGTKQPAGAWKTTRPDTDNLQKLLKDVMTDLGFWKDDALVVSEHIEKFWAKIPGIYICIESLEVQDDDVEVEK